MRVYFSVKVVRGTGASPSHSRSRRFAALTLLGLLLVFAGGLAMASDRFPDVPNTNVHHDNVNAIAAAGITAGCAGGNYCPGDFVRRDQMASFLARGFGLRSGQFPVGLAKSDYQTYCTLVSRHPRSFERGGCNWTTTVDSDPSSFGNVGEFISIAIGTDGNPVISYRDALNQDLKVAKCTNPLCSGAATITAVDTAGIVGEYTAIAIGADGNPVVSYHDGTNGNLKVAKCANPACAGTATITAVDIAGNVGLYTSLGIGTDGNPVISYYDQTNGDLKVVKCGNPACTGGTITAVDTAGNVGEFTSLAIGTDGNPVISYFDQTNRDLKVAKCTNPACTGAATITAVDTVGDVGNYTSITIGTDGRPVVSYLDGTNLDLKIAKCANPACTGAATITAVDTAGNMGFHTSIAIGIDGNPLISYRDASVGGLKLAQCANPACNGAATITAVDYAGNIGEYSSIAIGTDGNPVIAYRNDSLADLKFARPSVIL